MPEEKIAETLGISIVHAGYTEQDKASIYEQISEKFNLHGQSFIDIEA
jgi:3-deoxy-D-manno-octulosonate 8-phosphate phosphatase KdsC-like HAD superfamily phosphatase